MPPPLPQIKQQHRAYRLLNNEQPKLLRTRSAAPFDWHVDYRPFVERTGFLGLGLFYAELNNGMQIDNALINALVERWRSETHTFHLPVGEMTVTLEDVTMILGLPVRGRPVTFGSSSTYRGMFHAAMGVPPPVEERARQTRPSGLLTTWLRNNFGTDAYIAAKAAAVAQGVEVEPIVTQRHARAWIISLLGCTLFPDSTGNTIQNGLVQLACLDFEEIGSYSWASGVLAYLYRNLCDATTRSKTADELSGEQNIAGCMLLLQLWSWSRFYIGRPERTPRDDPPWA